jgi:hypothetical protein
MGKITISGRALESIHENGFPLFSRLIETAALDGECGP